MPQAPLPLVDAADIRRLVGSRAYERARPYARGTAVLEMAWNPETGDLTGVVSGSSERPYQCRIDLAPAAGEYHRPRASTCSCPVGLDCKHVAATLLASSAEHVAGLTDASAESGPRPRRSTEADRRPSEPAWKTAMAGLADEQPASTSRSPAARADAFAPLALQFELREITRPRHGRWQRATTSTAPATPRSRGKLRLAVRPVVRGASGRWIAGDVGWGSLAYRVSRMNLDERQVHWFGQLSALSRAETGVYLGQNQDRIILDDFPSPLLWRLLDDARRLGIELVAGAKGGSVTLAGEASIGLDAAASAAGLRLQTTVSFDGERVDPIAVAPIGDHGLYAVAWMPAPAITLAPSREPLTAPRRALLSRPEIVVPTGDVDEFLADYYPTLQRSVQITSADASARLPEIVPPTPVLTASFEAENTLTLDWEWEYRIGARAARKPLHPAGNETAHRDASTETEISSAVTDAWPDHTPGVLAASSVLHGFDAAEFVEHALPAIETLTSVRVDTVGDRPDYHELHETPTLKVTTVETDQRDWFDLGVLVTVEGRTVPFGPLFTALSLGKKKLLLVDHSYLSLQQPVFDRLRELIEEAQSLAEWETGPRISRYQASLWAEFEDLADESEQAVAWRATVGGLLELADAKPSEPPPLPAGLSASLRPYQHDGYAWLTFLWRHGLGGILADDMGLGKTLQTLALIAHARSAKPSSGPFLVVAPSSVVSNWLSEAARFTPHLRVAAVTTTQAKSGEPLGDVHADADIVVTSYTLFRLDFEAHQALDWSGLVLDEAQFVKNRASRAHECARDLAAPFKLAVTGTPMENNLMELWSLLAIVAPGLFPSARRFTEDYVRPISGSPGVRTRADATQSGANRAAEGATDSATDTAALLARLRRRIRPLMLRRTKEVVAPELPAKQEQVLQIELAPKHRKLYDTFLQRERQKLLGLIEDLDRNRFIVFRSLTLLRMLSLDASLIDEKYASVPSSKLDALFEQLEDVLAEGHRALIFSQFTSFLRKVADRFDANEVEYAYLDGSTRRRASVIKAFTDGTVPVFLISLKAGGFGLNLTEADYVFLLDPWWNPATEAQAVDRTHRIGQTKNVMVYRMVATGTIEEKVMALKEQKARLFDAVLEADEDAGFGAGLSADDIRGLLDA